jgi:nucleoside-diphosphate-sugar epimerase
MRLLITGAGLVGTALARRLQADHDVTLFDFAAPAEKLPVTYVRGDLRDVDALTVAFRGMDGVFHTAALHVVHYERFTRQEFVDVNVKGTYNVLEAAVECGVGRVVHCSTLGVMTGASWPSSSPIVRLTDRDVDEHRVTATLYSMTKLLNEHTLAYFRASFGLDVVALRFGVIWELARSLFREQLVAHALGGLVTGLDDAVEAQVAAMRHAGPLPRMAYTVAARSLASDLDAGADVGAALVGRYPALRGALPDPLPRLFAFDVAETERDLGFSIAGTADAYLQEALEGAIAR